MKSFILIIVTVLFFNCSKEEPIETKDLTNHMATFEQVVAINGNMKNSDESRKKNSPLELEFLNFDKSFELRKAYMIDGIAFNDDGKYNDKVAGDNIYTSTKLFSNDSNRERLSNYSGYSFSKNFEHRDFYSASGIKVGCKFRTVECTNTGFWDNDWGTGWGCVDFYDCEFEVEIF